LDEIKIIHDINIEIEKIDNELNKINLVQIENDLKKIESNMNEYNRKVV